MSAQSQCEREEDDIQKRFEAGEITNAEMWKELKELQREYRAAAQEQACEAYERELDRW